MEYKLDRSFRRTLMIQISKEGELVVKAPHLLSKKRIEEFILEKENWIRKKQELILENKFRTVNQNLSHGEKIIFLGEAYNLNIVSNQKEKIIFADNFYLGEKYLKNAKKILNAFYKEKSLELINKHLEEVSNEYGLKYNSFKITSGKKRLGSCSSRNDLTFTWRIVLAPEFVLRYIVCHELAHTVHHNHSLRFWNLVLKICPDYKKAKKWIKDNLYVLEIE